MAPSAPDRPHCLLCGQAGDPLFSGMSDRICGTPGEFTIRECARCELAWLDSDPVEEPHGAGYYTHAETAEHLREQAELTPRIRSVLAGRLNYDAVGPGAASTVATAVTAWRDHCESQVMFLHARPGGRLLDVGCGSGVLAARMRSLGWDVVCVEPDPESAAIARQTFGLTVYDGTLEEAALPAGTFDAVTLGHVIEHVPDPVGTLAVCGRLLMPGGVITAMTPNIRSLGRRVFGADWMHWDVPRHRYLFSPSSLSETARRAQLRPLESRTTARAARWAWRRSRELARGARIEEMGSGSARGPAAVGFALVEGALAGWSDAGEECLLIATVQ